MSIKRIRVLGQRATDVNDLTKTKFRSLDEVKEYIKQVYTNVRQAFKTLERYEKLFAGSKYRLLAAEIAVDSESIKINRYSKPGAKPLVKPGGANGLIVQKVDKVVIPNLDQLKENFDVVESLHDKMELLESLSEQISAHFSSDPQHKPILTAVKKMLTGIKAKVKAAMTLMNKLAKKHEPTAFKEVVETVVTKALTAFKGRFKSKKEVVYVTSEETQGGTALVFTHYLDLAGFSDDEGYAHSEFFIVFTCKVSPTGDAEYYVNVSPKFSIPGKFNVGEAFSDLKTGVHALSIQLELENFSGLLETLPLPIDKISKTNMQAKNAILESKIEKDKIIIKLQPKVKAADLQNIVIQISADVRGLLAAKIKSPRIKHMVNKQGKSYILTYILTMPEPEALKENRLDQHKIKLLQNRLAFSDDDIRKIMQALHR